MSRANTCISRGTLGFLRADSHNLVGGYPAHSTNPAQPAANIFG